MSETRCSALRTRSVARRGSVYVLVLSASLVVTMIGLTALTISRLRLERGGETSDWATAQTLARAGVEHALQHVSGSVTTLGEEAWRSAYAANASSATITLGEGTFAWSLVDEIDGNLLDDSTDPVAVVSVGRCGEAVHRLRIEMEALPCEAGLSCLEAAVQTGDRLEVRDGTLWSNGVLSANERVKANNADVYADAEAADSIQGSQFHRSTTEGIDARVLPSSGIFDLYEASGTEITMLSLTAAGTSGEISGVLLSPSSNPFGSPDPLGVYVIDCAGDALTIKDCRIVGTLVVRNAASGSVVEGSVSWEPAIANWPALLVEGDFDFAFGAEPLAESAGKNFNPAGTPWRGESDLDVADEYPSVIVGIAYVSGDVELNGSGPMTFEGSIIVGGELRADGVDETVVAHRDTWLDDPPPGFVLAGGAPRVVAGSFIEVVP